MPDLENIKIVVEITLLSSSGAEIYAFQRYLPPSWIFHFRFFPLWFYSVCTSPIGMLDPINIELAVGTAYLSSLGAEIHAFQCYRPPSRIFHFRFLLLWLCSVDTCAIGLPDPENIGIAVGIVLPSSLGAEIRWGSIGPPLAVYVSFLELLTA